MIRSMTGFGRASARAAGMDLWAEVKTVNNRYLKTSLRLPDLLADREMAIEAQVRNALKRGSVYVRLWIGGQSGDTVKEYRFDAARAKQYLAELGALAADTGVAARPALESVAMLPGVVVQSEPGIGAEDEVGAAADTAVVAALAACEKMREAEGAALAKDLRARAASLKALNARAKARSPLVVEEYRARLKERIAKLLQGSGVSVRDEDVTREVAYFADRCDVSEETTRLDHHCEAMVKLLDGHSPEAGRKLDFLAQEMLREANTLGSKSGDVELTALVLDMKSEIDKVKEQVQNVE